MQKKLGRVLAATGILLAMVGGLSGCNTKAGNTASSPSSTSATSSYTPPGSGPSSPPAFSASESHTQGKDTTMIPFISQLIPLADFSDEAQSPYSVLIDSPESLAAFYEENRERYGLDGNTPGESAFLTATQDIDATFFENNSLVLVLVQEGSGGVKHTFTALQSEGDTLLVNLRRTLPTGMAATVLVNSGYLLRAEGALSGLKVEVITQEAPL